MINQNIVQQGKKGNKKKFQCWKWFHFLNTAPEKYKETLYYK